MRVCLPKMTAIHKAGCWLHSIRVFFVSYKLLVTFTTSQHCGTESSLYGKMLSGHTFKTVDVEQPWQCTQKCTTDVKCQSINYVMSSGKCELNNRTKEARPGDFVTHEDRIYIKRWAERGKCRIFLSYTAAH